MKTSLARNLVLVDGRFECLGVLLKWKSSLSTTPLALPLILSSPEQWFWIELTVFLVKNDSYKLM